MSLMHQTPFGPLSTLMVAQALVQHTAVRTHISQLQNTCSILTLMTCTAVQVNTTMFIMFGYDFTVTALPDIHALDTINWRWVTQFSASGYPLQSNNSTLSPASNSTSSLSTGAIAGIAVGGGIAVVRNISYE